MDLQITVCSIVERVSFHHPGPLWKRSLDHWKVWWVRARGENRDNSGWLCQASWIATMGVGWGIDGKRIRAWKLQDWKAFTAQWEGEIRFQQVDKEHKMNWKLDLICCNQIRSWVWAAISYNKPEMWPTLGRKVHVAHSTIKSEIEVTKLLLLCMTEKNTAQK